MSEPVSFAAPLELTERVKTPAGPLRIVLDTYPSGALRIELRPDLRNTASSSMEISDDIPDGGQLARGEFAVACMDAAFSAALLKGGLFRPTGKKLADKAIWSLDGLAIIEFLSAFAPPVAASKASFPSHLFNDRPFDPDVQQALTATFEDKGHMHHSPEGKSVWMLREYCEKKKIPFAIYVLKRGEETAGILFCKKNLASALCKKEEEKGYSVQTVYESPVYPGR